MKKLFLIIILFLVIGNVSANEVQKENNKNELKFERLENKIVLLEKELDNYNKLQSEYKTIVYWVIGLIITLFGGIVFLNWFQAFKLGKQEIENIKQEIKNDNKKNILSLKNTLESNIEERNGNIKKIIKSEIKNKFYILGKKIQNIESKLFSIRENIYLYEFKDKLIQDIEFNEYDIDDTLDKLIDYLKKNKIDTEDKIQIENDLIEVKNYITQKLGDDILHKGYKNRIDAIIKDYLK